MPLQATSGAASYDAFGGGVAAVPNYIEDIFSTHLYTGNGSTQTITNGIDLAGKGGLTWIKARNTVDSHRLFDTSRGVGNYLVTNGTFAQLNNTSSVTSFNSDGFSLGNFAGTNDAFNYASWTFREQTKFFDVVTYTGDGSSSLNVSHNLGSVPGCIIWKRTDSSSPWGVWHRASGIASSITGASLNATNAFAYTEDGTTHFTSTYFQPSWINADTGEDGNTSGATYVAYLFAHNAGGFGLTGTDNVITCGSYVGNGSASGPVINLGYEPQWVLAKGATDVSSWRIGDNMRGLVVGGDDSILLPNSSAAETTSTWMTPTATGFQIDGTSSAVNTSGSTYIYIAIRRGPMKVPTDATKVFSPVAQSGGGTVTTNFPVDLVITTNRNGVTGKSLVDRLRGDSQTSFVSLDSNSTAAEYTGSGFGFGFDNNTGYKDNGVWSSGQSIIYENFRRAPSFFDEVCYTGTGANRTINHNLGVAPELMIVKCRSGALDWTTYQAPLGASQVMRLNSTIAAFTDASVWNGTAPTSSVFSVGTSIRSNSGGDTFVVYLFATCAGVSKVFSFTGNGTTQTINCGFTGGARFVLLKASSATGGWYVYDTARGMTVLTDPYLQLNSTAAESATLGSVTTVTTGFSVNESILAGVNTNGVSYIGLAIA